MEKTERTQHQAALAITGAWQGSCRSKLYGELGWESILLLTSICSLRCLFHVKYYYLHQYVL